MTNIITMVLYTLGIQCVVMYSVSGYVVQKQFDFSQFLNDKKNPEKVTVHHFAIHGLCSHDSGQQYFYKVLKTKMCDMRAVFVTNRVLTMCEKKNDELYDWVEELFDIDGDGYISYFEKLYYKDDD